MFFFDPLYFLILAPAMLLMAWAQLRVRSTYSHAMQMSAPLSGAAAARYILDEAGCQNVAIEEIGGQLSDHYDPRQKVLRLSSDVYHSRSMAAVGIAAHEAGHAMQDAHGYLPLGIRNAAVPAATWGPRISIVLLIIGALFHSPHLILLGLAAFGALLVFQIVNLPVEFDATNRAKRVLNELKIVDHDGAMAVRGVLNAAAWTYVAATLQSVLTMVYYVLRFSGGMGSRDDA